MARRTSPPSLHWLTLAVLLPLGVLAAVAWTGLEAQSQAIRNQLQEERLRMAHFAAKQVALELEGNVIECRSFPDPPEPGTASPTDEILDGTDREALASLRDSPDAGYSPAGLPRRVLAALRLEALGRSSDGAAPSNEADLVRLVTAECPSILTELALANAGATREVHRWRERSEMADLLRAQPEGGWILIDPLNNGLKFLRGWVRPHDGGFRYLSSSKIELAIAREHLPGLRMAWSAQSTTLPGRISVPVPFDEGLWLATSSMPEGVVESTIRRQRVWATGFLGSAVAVSLAGLFFLHRTLRRERQLNEMKSQFVASVSHELRAPVASIRLMADALEADKVAPETAREFHRLIAREGARLSTLVGNVLDHARIEQGKRVWKMEPCDLESLVADTLRVMEPLAREKNIALRSALSPVEAAVDAGAIQQALVNLLDNAIKFSPAGSMVETTLSIDEERRTWRVAVKDEGPGIAKAEQARIFERFYRPGDELRRETQGTGIGLSLVKAIAEAHGGSVSVESEPGQGSTFTLTASGSGSGSAGLQTGPPGPPVFRPAVGDHSHPPDDPRCRGPLGRSQTGAPGDHSHPPDAP